MTMTLRITGILLGLTGLFPHTSWAFSAAGFCAIVLSHVMPGEGDDPPAGRGELDNSRSP